MTARIKKNTQNKNWVVVTINRDKVGNVVCIKREKVQGKL